MKTNFLMHKLFDSCCIWNSVSISDSCCILNSDSISDIDSSSDCSSNSSDIDSIGNTISYSSDSDSDSYFNVNMGRLLQLNNEYEQIKKRGASEIELERLLCAISRIKNAINKIKYD
jgi:hypothetical protein